MALDGVECFVLDIGSYHSRFGLAGEDDPRGSFPTLVGSSKNDPKTMYVGDEVYTKQPVDCYTHLPVEGGVVVNWDWMEAVYQHIFDNELRMTPEGRNVLLSDAPFNPQSNREKVTQMMFETFNTDGFWMENQGVLSLYASGRTTGVVLDCGFTRCHSIPIYEGFAVRHGIQTLRIGGRDLRDNLMKILSERGYGALGCSSSEREIYRDMKEKLCYIARNFQPELDASDRNSYCEKEYELPDGKKIVVGNERFRCPEALFQPHMIGKSSPGVAEMIYNSISNTGYDARVHMYANTLLTGGTSKFPGFQDRLMKDLQDIGPSCMKMKVLSPPNRESLCWVGGTVLGSLSVFENLRIRKDEYDECGPNVVQMKCL